MFESTVAFARNSVSRTDRNFRLDFDREVKWEPMHSDGRPSVTATFGAKHAHDEIGKSIYNEWELGEAFGRVYHSEYAKSCIDLVKIP